MYDIMNNRIKKFLFIIFTISITIIVSIFLHEKIFNMNNNSFISLNANKSFKASNSRAVDSYCSKIFTRKELQDIMVSTAMSYYFNRTYTDYEQWGMDEASTYEWRKYSNSPEMVSRNNYFNSTCSTFTGIVDLYSIGYDLSTYYKYSNISYRNYDDSGALTKKNAKDSVSNFQTAYNIQEPYSVTTIFAVVLVAL